MHWSIQNKLIIELQIDSKVSKLLYNIEEKEAKQ